MSITTIFLDLDNTLLHNPDRDFALDFLALFNQHMHDALGHTGCGSLFRQAIKLASHTPEDGITNTARLINLLSQAANQPTSHVAKALAGFYDTAYGQLKTHIRENALATPVIEALEDDYTIVIATNPLYSHQAILQRMAWGQLPHHKTYALITSADNMYSAKPHPSYYQKLLDDLNIAPSEAVMVGDSLKNDIEPAESLGIHTYHVDSPEDLDGILYWLEQH